MVVGMWGSLGDEVALTGIIRELKRIFPDEYISVINKFPELFYNNPHVNSGKNYSLLKLLIPTSPCKEEYINRVQSYANFIEIPTPIENTEPEIFLTQDEINLFSKQSYNVYAIDPWAGWPSRRWNIKNYIQLTDLIKQYDPTSKVIEVGKSTKDCFGNIRNVSIPNVDQSYVDKLSVRETASLLKSCKLFVGGDSGLFHLSASVGTKHIVLYTIPHYRKAYKDSLILYNRDYACSDICLEMCPKSKSCIDYFDAEDVMVVIKRCV
jgi:ADP-heptose:LPS heptosyltransferase